MPGCLEHVLDPGGCVDHRVGAAPCELLFAKVQQDMRARGWRQAPVWAQRHVRVHSTEMRRQKKHRLLEESAAAEQASNCSALAAEAGHGRGGAGGKPHTKLWLGQSKEPEGGHGCALEAAARADIAQGRLPGVHNRTA